MMQLSHSTSHSTVGVAPGTTTLQLGDCPPDEAWQYVLPPQVTEGPAPGVAPDVTQMPTPQYWNPYQDPPSLKGLGGASNLANASWSLVAFVGIAAFAVAFGVFYWKGRHGK
jgi:hypothetical protein